VGLIPPLASPRLRPSFPAERRDETPFSAPLASRGYDSSFSGVFDASSTGGLVRTFRAGAQLPAGKPPARRTLAKNCPRAVFASWSFILLVRLVSRQLWKMPRRSALPLLFLCRSLLTFSAGPWTGQIEDFVLAISFLDGWRFPVTLMVYFAQVSPSLSDDR